MNYLLLKYKFAVLLAVVFAGITFSHDVLALGEFDLGGIYNPINIQIVPTQQQLNQQKAANLQSSYGMTAYNSCRTWCQNTAAFADPQVEASCLIQVEACLKLRATPTQNTQPQCASGYVPQNGVCISGCQAKYGQFSFWNGNMTNGSYSCDCVSGYTWNTDKTSCVVKATCPDQNNSYLGTDSMCYCKSGLVWNQPKTLCVTQTLTCPSGQTPSNGQCVSLDAGCKTSYGQDSMWTGTYATNGNYVCGCVDGYEWNSGSTACVAKKRVCQYGQYDNGSQCVTYDDGCKRDYGQLSIWSGRFETDGRFICDCPNGYGWDTDNKTCVQKTVSVPVDPVLTKKMLGYILLDVQSHGEAWYVRPETSTRHYMKDGAVAYSMMRFFGSGIADADLKKIPLSETTAEIKSATNVCLTNPLANRMKGKIMLQVQQHGEAYYVYPKNCRRIYLKDGAAAYEIMRYLGLGIATADLNKISQ